MHQCIYGAFDSVRVASHKAELPAFLIQTYAKYGINAIIVYQNKSHVQVYEDGQLVKEIKKGSGCAEQNNALFEILQGKPDAKKALFVIDPKKCCLKNVKPLTGRIN